MAILKATSRTPLDSVIGKVACILPELTKGTFYFIHRSDPPLLCRHDSGPKLAIVFSQQLTRQRTLQTQRRGSDFDSVAASNLLTKGPTKPNSGNSQRGHSTLSTVLIRHCSAVTIQVRSWPSFSASNSHDSERCKHSHAATTSIRPLPPACLQKAHRSRIQDRSSDGHPRQAPGESSTFQLGYARLRSHSASVCVERAYSTKAVPPEITAELVVCGSNGDWGRPGSCFQQVLSDATEGQHGRQEWTVIPATNTAIATKRVPIFRASTGSDSA